jgi:NADP-dependent 3-hydroxy acid dehydrogenase YdfG
MSVTGKVALITGGGSGLGESAARILANEGAKVAVLGRTADEIQEVAQSITSSGGEAIAVTADIAVPSEVEAAVQQIIDQWGRLDIVFANAGINGVWHRTVAQGRGAGRNRRKHRRNHNPRTHWCVCRNYTL